MKRSFFTGNRKPYSVRGYESTSSWWGNSQKLSEAFQSTMKVKEVEVNVGENNLSMEEDVKKENERGLAVEVYDVDVKGNLGTLKESFKYKGDIWLTDQGQGKFFGKYTDHFAVKFKGLINVPAGKHTFKVGHDDGAKLKIGDIEKSSWVLTGYIEDLSLEISNESEKLLPFELSFFEWEGAATLTLKMDDKRVPATMFYQPNQITPETPKTYNYQQYSKIGCFADGPQRAVEDASALGYNNGNYKSIPDAINKCGNFAKEKKFPVFGIQDDGWCATSADADVTYNKYGPATNCGTAGKGGPWSNDVYTWN